MSNAPNKADFFAQIERLIIALQAQNDTGYLKSATECKSAQSELKTLYEVRQNGLLIYLA